MTAKSSLPEKKFSFGDTLFAVVHVLLLLSIFIYGLVSIVLGNIRRAVVIFGCLVVYYVLVLHKPVVKELERRRNLKSGAVKARRKNERSPGNRGS